MLLLVIAIQRADCRDSEVRVFMVARQFIKGNLNRRSIRFKSQHDISLSKNGIWRSGST